MKNSSRCSHCSRNSAFPKHETAVSPDIVSYGRDTSTPPMRPSDLISPPKDTKLPGIDFVGLARSMGCEAVRVERPQDLGPKLTAALESPVPYLVDVAVV